MSHAASPSRRRKMPRSEYGDSLNDEVASKRLPPLPNFYTPNLSNEANAAFENMIKRVDTRVDTEKIQALVVDFLICEGYKEAAEFLCAESHNNVPDEEKECLEKRYEIRTSIVLGDIAQAIDQINGYVPSLLTDHPKLHFQLRRQQLVELIRDKKIKEALEFAKDNLVPIADQPPELLTKLEQTYGLLVFDKPETSPFGYLMDMNQRNILAAEVNSLICGIGDRNPTSKLEQLFRLIVWNKQQLTTRGEAVSQPDDESAAKIARAIFCPEDELHRGIADF